VHHELHREECHIRVAMTASDAQIADAAARIQG
jgi:hypothetical protein